MDDLVLTSSGAILLPYQCGSVFFIYLPFIKYLYLY